MRDIVINKFTATELIRLAMRKRDEEDHSDSEEEDEDDEEESDKAADDEVGKGGKLGRERDKVYRIVPNLSPP